VSTRIAGPDGPVRRLSLEEWGALAEDEPGELVDGIVEEEEMPNFAHEIVVAWLVALLRAWARPRGGFALPSESKIAVGPNRGRKPDVVVFFGGRALPVRRDSISRVAPDIVIEVITPTPRDGRRDRVEKKSDYARIGVSQYWLVDPELRTIEILVRGEDGRFIEAVSASTGSHEVPACEGLSLDLDSLWAEVEAWPDQDDKEPSRSR
jgi:Uma2 family endonuclease